MRGSFFPAIPPRQKALGGLGFDMMRRWTSEEAGHVALMIDGP
jgi:hypothetical protein